ncbi:MAG TPA: peptide chain release factor N(5)-glutamine methyltransferase [Thermoanaerobaculia bacterium]
MTVGEVLRDARGRLARASFKPSPREAALLLGNVLGRGEAALLARGDETVDAAARRRFEALLERRLRGEPVAYLLGEREFYGRPFRVDDRVLIPRPETEHLIEAVLALGLPLAPRVLDVGTGSGAIAVTVALEVPGARVVASDLSLGTLEVLAANARGHGVAERVLPVLGDLTAALDLGGFDLVVANPPYVDPDEAVRLSPEVVAFEPHLALFAPGSGRSTIARLLAAAPALRRGTPLVIEIGYDQSEWLEGVVGELQGLELEGIVKDLAGHPRTAILRRR